MIEFLQNQWVVGIGGGIISGIIVFFITKWILQRKDKSRYFEQISSANIDIIRTLKPYVAEKGLPDKQIIDAIISSVARKYNVEYSELYSVRVVCEELICEIIGNVYVSAEKKKEYSIQLQKYLQELDIVSDRARSIYEIEIELKNKYDTIKLENMKRFRVITSTFMSAIALLLTTLTNFFVSNDIFVMPKITKYDDVSIMMLGTITVIVSITIVITYLLLFLKKIINK